MVLRDFGGFGPGSIPIIAWDGLTLLIMAATAFRLLTAPLILHFGDMEGETHGSARFATNKETAALRRPKASIIACCSSWRSTARNLTS